MRAKVLRSPGYSFKAEVEGNTYEVESIDKDDNDVYLIIDHKHDVGVGYEAGTVWRFDLDGVEFTEEEKMGKIAIGDKVTLNPTSEFVSTGSEDTSNPLNVVGTVIRYDVHDLESDRLGIHVQWENGLINSYRDRDLRLVGSTGVSTPRKAKQKPKRRQQTIVYFVYKDGTDYQVRRAKGVVINAEHKEIHVDSERSLGKGLVIRENSSVPFKLLDAVRVSTPDGEFCYYFTDGELTGSAREFNAQLPFKTQMH